MTRDDLIETIARRMAKDDRQDPDVEIVATAGAPLFINGYSVMRPNGNDVFTGPLWHCYRSAAAKAVDYVTLETVGRIL